MSSSRLLWAELMKVFRLVIFSSWQSNDRTIGFSSNGKTVYAVKRDKLTCFVFPGARVNMNTHTQHVATNRLVKDTLRFFSCSRWFACEMFTILKAHVTCGWFIGISYASPKIARTISLALENSGCDFYRIASYQRGQTNNCECNNLRPFRILFHKSVILFVFFGSELRTHFTNIRINSSVNKIK